jgi:hypothetical protein
METNESAYYYIVLIPFIPSFTLIIHPLGSPPPLCFLTRSFTVSYSHVESKRVFPSIAHFIVP